MNERINELARQAQQYAECTTPQGLEWLPAFKEKFAELIVKECCNIMAEYSHRPAGVVKRNVKEHFGVEE